MRFCRHFLSLVAVIVVTTTIVNGNEHDFDHGKALIDWVRNKGGSFNKKLEIRRSDPNDPDSLAVFAKERLAAAELLFEIPAACAITSDPPKQDDEVFVNYKKEGEWLEAKIATAYPDGTFDVWYESGEMELGVTRADVDDGEESSGMSCTTAQKLIDEMRLGEDSEFAPYLNYLRSQRTGKLPSAWSNAGKKLITKIVGTAAVPEDVAGWSWQSLCNGGADPFEENAALLIVQRAQNDVMVPIFDMLQHRNGKLFNTKTNPIEKEENVLVQASRLIEAGEQLFTSYNFCSDCGRMAMEYGTPELFRDGGFIEPYPQRWIFEQEHTTAFELNRKMNADGTLSNELDIMWLQVFPPREGLIILERFLKHLHLVAETDLKSPSGSVPSRELDAIKEYHQAATTAVTYAIKAAHGEIFSTTSQKRHAGYSSLKPRKDRLDYGKYCCEQGMKMDFPGYEDIDQIESTYQNQYYSQDPITKDTCLQLDTIVQICGSYRPHYHEMMVHYPARFLEKIKRVAFVGGGDSMLLHEIIKYPSLELVIGLEIDQKVTRGSFKHFGTQPHWDNDKVQWWYGDAAKSLLMLPKDYFGSFDLVLVDLSETVMSMTVTKGVDIFDALGMLLKDEGILVKNELYLEQFSQLWDYTTQIHFYDVPAICSQALILGSNKVDFLHRTPKDHDGVENLYMKTLNETDDYYDIYHDYRKSVTRELKHCKGEDDDEEAEEQENSPGILMILEAENASLTYDSSQQVQKAISNALEKEGFTVKSTIDPKNGADGIIVAGVILEEGFVVARGWPSDKYFAFDVHLWSSFEKHSSAKEALIEAVGSSGGKSSSSYRIVAGGMFGVTSWRDDEKNRGPRFTRDCERPEGVVREGVMSNSALNTILQDSMALIKDDNIIVSVVCGYEEDECKSIDSMKTTEIVSNVVPIWTCPGLKSKQTGKGDLSACEKVLLDTLLESSKEEKVRAIVIDPSAPFRMGQIIHRFFNVRMNKVRFLADDIMVMAPMVRKDEEWRRSLMDSFRQEIIINEPVFLSQVLFNSSDSSIELAVTSSGDANFIQHLNEVRASIEKRSGLVSDVRNIQGGLFTFQVDFEPTQFFLPSAYDQSSPYEQWKSQKPIGHQTVFQLETKSKEEPEDLSFAEVGSTVKGILAKLQKSNPDAVELHEFENVGDGFLLVGLWSGGTVSVLWDGNIHVDLNVFTYTEIEKVHLAFRDLFIQRFSYLETILHDEQPRGSGRVVNFVKDLQDSKAPHWV